MAIAHSGSWFGLPDFGITEKVQSVVKPNSARSSQGGSNLFGTQKAAAPTKAVQGASTSNTTPYGPPGPPAGYKAPTSYSAPTNNQPQQSYAMDTGPSYDDFGAQIDSAYGEASGLLDQFEQNTRAGEQDLYTSATAPVDAQKPILEQALSQGLAGVEGQKTQAQLQEQNALAAARRLYQELTQGAKQRFGAGNSAGEFANGLLGREFQKNVGSIRQTAGQNMQSLLGKSQEIQSNYNTQLQALEQQKEGLLAQARDEFRRRIDAINNTRFGLAQNKAQAKLQELQNLRAYAQSLQAQAIQFQQQLQANVQKAQLQLEAQVQAYRAQAGQPVSMAAFSNPAYTQLPGATVSTSNPQTTGFLSFGTNREDERNRMFA